MLSDKTIETLSLKQDLIKPYDKRLLQPCSYDMKLGPTILFKRGSVHKRINLEKKHFLLKPKTMALGTTVETVNIPKNICGMVEGKSSLGRLGLFVHITAGVLDPGFNGQITLEFYNGSDEAIDLTKFLDRPICQVVFHELDTECGEGYNGHYQNQKDTTESWLN